MHSRRITQHASLLTIVLRLLDAVGIVGAAYLAAWLVDGVAGHSTLAAAVSAAVLYFVAAEVTGLYRSWHGVSGERELLCAVGNLGARRSGAVDRRLLLATCSSTATRELTRSRNRRPGSSLRRSASSRPARHCGSISAACAARVATSAAWRSSAARRSAFNWPATSSERRGADCGPSASSTIDRPSVARRCRPTWRRASATSTISSQQARDGRVHMIYITLPLRAENRIKSVLAPPGRHDGVGLSRARFLRLRVAALALDQRRRLAGGQRVRESVLRRRRHGQTHARRRRRQHCLWSSRRLPMAVRRRGGQALVARPGLLPAEALRPRRSADRRLEVPQHARLRERRRS